MNDKIKGLVVSSVILWVSLVFVPCNVTIAQLATNTVTHEYFVVAGHNMTPLPPVPALSPVGFQFTGTPEFMNFGNVTKKGSFTYLSKQEAVKVNITNLLGYDITITNLTAEVTAGTKTLDFIAGPMITFSNFTNIGFSALDPFFDEVDYYTGEVDIGIDQDEYYMAVGTPSPESMQPFMRNDTLLQPDQDGDAEATGHVAPISLVNGSTLTEYFGVVLMGDAELGTQINGTITLTLIYEYTPPGAPTASFTYTPTAPLIGQTITFDASSSTPNGGNLTSYTWDFGDGSTDTGLVVSHTYTEAGSYTVVLNVTDSEAQWASDEVSVVVGGPPVARFTYTPTEPTVDELVTFNASTSTPNGGILTDPTSYVWDFGDGQTGTGRLVTHSYTMADDYVVTLNVTDSQGQSATAEKSLTVDAKAEEFPWLYIGVGLTAIIVVIAAVAVYAKRRK